MKILIWSRYGDALSLARIMKERENQEVLFYVDVDYNKRVGEGIVPKVDDWKDYINWADLIICDDENQGDWIEVLDRQGKVVFGTNKFGGKLENDREYTFKVLEQLGLSQYIIPYWKFTNFDEGIKFIKENPGRYVFKPFGQRPRYYTKIGEREDGKDLIWFIKYLKTVWKGSQNFILQKYVRGIEVGCCAWFNRKRFLRPLEICFEHKKMKNYGGGGNVGEAGSLILAVEDSIIFNRILSPFEKWLKNTRYVGQFYVNTKIDEDNIWILEFVPRLGIPATYLYDELLKISWSEMFYKISTSELDKMPLELSKFVIGVKVDIEPIPDIKEEAKYSVPTEIPVFFDFEIDKNFFEGDLRKENEQYYLTGKQGHIGVAVGSGKTVQEAQDKAYEIVDKVYCPFNITYNPEIGDKYIFIEEFLKDKKIL